MCMVTGARAPAFFLIEFHALNHPKTGAPWFVPDELVQSGVRLIKNHDTIQATGSRAMNVEAVGEDSTLEKDGTSSISSKPSQLPVVRSGAYLLARPEVLHHISKKSRRSAEIFKLAPRRWKDDKSMKTKELVWREDMEDFVRNMLRRTVVAKLKYLESRKAGYIQRDRNGFDEIEKIQRLGAVLWLGPPPIRKARYTSEVTDQDSERGPPPLAMANYRGRYVPIYNLRTMLGIELVQALREHSGVFEGEIVMIKAKANTVRTQMILWKLQLYMTTSDSSGEFT